LRNYFENLQHEVQEKYKPYRIYSYFVIRGTNICIFSIYIVLACDTVKTQGLY